MTSPVVVGIDLGGTNLKAAIVNRDGRVLVSRTLRREAHAPEQVSDAMVSLSDHLLAEADVDRSALRAVGVGSPGPLDLDAGRVIRWANLPGWVDVP
ncbi:MAG: ROK family protein, partial [Phycisphaerae bacterium]